MRYRGGSESGFALVEAIATMALSGLTLMTLVISAGLVTRNSARVAERIDTVEVLASGLAALRRDVEEIRYVRTGNAESTVLFFGGPHALGMALGPQASDDRKGEALVWIEARYENGQNILVRSSAQLTPRIQSFDRQPLARPVVLLSGAWDYEFSYADASPGPLSWQSNWSDAAHLPAFIRLEILQHNSSRAALPPLIMPVPIQGNAG